VGPAVPLVPAAICAAAAAAVFAVVELARRTRRRRRALRALTAAARRLAGGDRLTPVPSAPGHAAPLAAALETLRGRLAALEEDVRRREAEARAIIDGVAEGVFAVDRERRVTFASPSLLRLLGRRESEVVGRFCGDVFHPRAAGGPSPCDEQCPILHARFRGAARATEFAEGAGGARRALVLTSAAPVGGLQVQVARDESDIEGARRLRDAVLANISHEFRTPLAAQRASIELLLARLPELSADETGRLLLSLQRGTLRLTRLIDNLLESVRIEAGETGVRRRPTGVDEVVEEALEMTRPLLDQRRQRVALRIPDPAPTLLGDAPRLAQVLVNLIANANKFAPEGTEIEIGAAEARGEVRIWVEDEGPGFPDAEGPSFERFRRAEEDEPEQAGVGLGLYIAKSIVERHGGRVAAGGGTRGARVCIILPAEGPDAGSDR